MSALLWTTWFSIVHQLRPAFSRKQAFLWFATALAGFAVRGDRNGVSSFVRALGLDRLYYDRLLDFFHSKAVNLPKLTSLWTALVLKVMDAHLFRVNGHIVVAADGIKVAKTGVKMPAVKKLHQESQNNSKPEFIFGHSCQALAVIVRTAKGYFALPLACRIHEGLVFSNRDKRTLLDKLVLLFADLVCTAACIMVADAYYASGKVIVPLLKAGHHLVTAVRSNAVAFGPAPTKRKRGRGRPKKYGRKIKLTSLFDDASAFLAAASPVYGEEHVTLSYRCVDLLWRPCGTLVRFVAVIHPQRGRRIFLCTDTTLDPIDIIKIYGVRFKIEVSFKQAIHTVGTYQYHFWMAAMTPRPNKSGNQYLHHKSVEYREAVLRKLAAYHCHIQTGIIAHGLLQILAVLEPQRVWGMFGSWIRTIRPGIAPSEQVVASALRYELPEFLKANSLTSTFAKFLHDRIDLDRAEGQRLVS